jgi:TRAP-type transport system periplasmic protein
MNILKGGGKMKKKIGFIGGLFLALLMILSTSGMSQAAPIVLKLGNIQAPTSSASIACERMAKLVAERSNNQLKIDLFPASQLGNAITQLEGVMMGTKDMFQDAAEWMSQFEKDYNILAMAFAFRDYKHLQAFFNSPLNTEIRERLRKDRGLRVISESWNRAPRDLLSKKPVYAPKDLQGIKMRVPEIEMYLKVWKAMGTQPTQVAWGETYLALMQGVVDAMEGPFDTLLPMKFYEAAPNIAMTDHLISASSVSINDKKFMSLPKNLQDILVASAKEAGDLFSKLGVEAMDKDKKEMESKGAKFINVDRKPFMEKVAPLAKEMEDQGKWTKGLYQKIQDLK